MKCCESVGEEGCVSVPERRHGSCGKGLRTILRSIPLIILYQ